MDFRERYDQTKMLIEKNLLDHIQEIKNTRQRTLYESMRYSLTAGGKRFRPVLHLETVRLLQGDIEKYVDSACALEYIHTYSLIHDDLPAMDNDDYRRGKPTNHKCFGEDIAILAGDALLNQAFEILFNKIELDPSISNIRGAKLIAENAGSKGLIAGQILDIQSGSEEIDPNTLLYIHQKKTGALIEAAILSAAYMMEATSEEIDALKKYALHLGIAFQIADDILDVTGSFEMLGKPIGSDAENQKSTFVTCYGMEESKKILEQNVQEAIYALNIFSEKKFLEELASYVATRNS
ncbi:MAG: polyprenyl synthetase family protein [Peptostreptococcaceae bacterium]|nr:polyprenyl synthetase family protein [Peptostreptococcaceae bacterium]